MASTEKVLKALQNAKIATLAATEPEELVIDAESRTITVPSSERLFGVTGDKDVERKYFQCPKIVGDNIDLSQHQIYISYAFTTSENNTIFPTIGNGRYHCEDVEVSGDNITFSWLLSGNVLSNPGFIAFKVKAMKNEGDELKTKWNTSPAFGTVLITVPDGEDIAEEYPDVINQIFDRLDALESGGSGGGGTPGKDGREIEIQNSGTAIQWRYVGDESWTDLVQLSDITGAKGDPGEDGITPTIGENRNWYLGETDTGKPSRGEKGNPGDKGNPGEKGDPGPTGATPNIQIGTVQTLEPGQQATASMTGTPENPLLNLGIPKGEKGDPGEDAESGDSYTLPIMSDTQLGGGKAVKKTDEDVPVAVDPSTGQLFVPTYPESASADIPRQEMQNTDTEVTIEPNKLYVFPEMASLTVTLGTPSDANVANEYHFFFNSGVTATTLTLNDVLSDAYSIEANMKYEVSILEGIAYIKGVSTSAET